LQKRDQQDLIKKSRGPSVPAPRKKSMRRQSPAILSARLDGHVMIEARSAGDVVARFNGMSLALGQFSPAAAARAKELHTGLPLAALAGSRKAVDKELDLLVRRLAARGLLEFHLARPGPGQSAEDLVVIEPQAGDYWPSITRLRDTDTLVLSRFAYIRRRAQDMVLESPRARALFRICDPAIAAMLAALATRRSIKQLRQTDGFPGPELLALLLDCDILFKASAKDENLRIAEGDDNLILWDFHDLLFHARSTEGRHANPLGGTYFYAETVAPLPAVRPSWPGARVDLRQALAPPAEATRQAASLLRQRHSTRDFDGEQPITLGELAYFLDSIARVQSTFTAPSADGEPPVSYAPRPYPSGGGSYELELYLAVDNCAGLARGLYHYDAGEHALVAVDVEPHAVDTMLRHAQFAMNAAALPQIVITLAARFGRISWKYSSLAYSLILKDTGVLMQTLYLMATDMGLGGCAIGSTHIDLFEKMTGIPFHIEGPVGVFALGRGMKADAGGPSHT
jgi:SagB-type dehydrogenase family enzyme